MSVTIAGGLSDFTASLAYEQLPPEVVHQAKRLLVDTVGCAIGGYSSFPALVAREIANEVTSRTPATILGSTRQTSLDLATFANGVTIRYLDFNDTYIGWHDAGHPSDAIAAVLSPGEVAKADGRSVITAIALAYEVFIGLCDAVNVRGRGFEHATLGIIASTAAAAKVMRLPPERIEQAINLAVTANNALLQNRLDEISHWKGCAFANASRNAVFAVELSARGLTGPSQIFEGPGGFFAVVSGQAFSFEPSTNTERFRILDTTIKRFPVGTFAQTVIAAALQVRDQIPNVDLIESVQVQTATKGLGIMAGGPEKWAPATRETADHSIPYAAAVALRYGTLEARHFGDEFLQDEELKSLVGKVTVSPSPEADQSLEEVMRSRVTVTSSIGTVASATVPYPRGHPKNPMTDLEISEKFMSLAEGRMAPSQIESVLDALWNLERVRDIGELVRMVIVDDADG